MKASFAWISALLFSFTTSAQVSTVAQQRAAAERFGVAVTEALNQRDRKGLAELIDIEELLSRAADVQGLNGAQRQAYVRSTSQGGAERIADSVLRTLEASDATAKFMRVTDTVPPRSLVRIDMGDNGFTYLEYLVQTRGGRTRTPDWYQVSTGDLVSVSIGGINQLFTSHNPGLFERLLGKVDAQTSANFMRIHELRSAGKYAEALPLFGKIPEPIANSRIILALWASNATIAGAPEEYERVLTRMARHHGNDPAAAFMLMDYYFGKKDQKQLLQALDLIERRVGVDAMTRLVRSNAYNMNADFTTALKYADEAIRLEPDRLDGYDTRATNLVQLGRFQEAVDAYRAMEKNFSLEFTREVFADPVFGKFVESRPFKAWLPK